MRLLFRFLNRAQLVIIIGITSVMSCAPKPTPVPTFAFPTSIAGCFPTYVFTAEDMQARVNCHPDNYKIEINQDTVVLFAFHDPVMDWVAPIFIIHIPSVSDTTLDINENILSEVYNSLEGESAIKEVLNNSELMKKILKQANEIGLFR